LTGPQSSGFFALRTPLLPFDTLLWLSAGLQAPAATDDDAALARALAADRLRIRERLQRLVGQPEVRDALHVASPDLEQALDAWRAAPDTLAGATVERSLLRNVSLMASRPTPLGLLSVMAVGNVADTTSLAVAGLSECRRRTRLDIDYLVQLADALSGDRDLAAAIDYRPNTSLYRSADQWRYVETRRRGKERSYHLVAVNDTPALTNVLGRAAEGATADVLAALLTTANVSADDAAAFVHELVAQQVLVSDLACPITGDDPLDAMAATLAAAAPDHAANAALAQVAGALHAIDRTGLGVAPSRYRDLAARLEAFTAPVDRSRLLHVDLVRPGDGLTLAQDVVDEIARGAALLHRLARPADRDPLAAFRTAFVERYGQRAVPLAEALDEDTGIGAALGGSIARDASPLLADLGFPSDQAESVAWNQRETALLHRVGAALEAGDLEIALEARDIEELSTKEPRPLPATFAVVATLIASGAEALARGDARVLLHMVDGPSGANLLGRFCHADASMSEHVRSHLRDEERQDPEAVFAEIVHLPEAAGDVLLRPQLREYEIPYLGRSGASISHQIPVSDLTLSVVGERFVLRSARLGRRVVPRLTSERDFSPSALVVYRLLGLLQADGAAASLNWSWGALAALPFLPRVTSGRLVLARARWRVTGREIRALADLHGATRFRAVQEWRRTRRLPPWVVLADWESVLPVHLDNVTSCESLVELLEGRDEATLVELLPGPDELCATGPQGSFAHEIVIPFSTPVGARPKALMLRDVPPQTVTAPTRQSPRTFPPGSKWVYAKLYAGAARGDRLIVDTIGPVSRRLENGEAIDRWFFVRDADPEPHVRWWLRAAARQRSVVVSAAERALVPLVTRGLVRRATFDTYEPEVERYGGSRGLAAAERLFWADSTAVVDLLHELRQADASADMRWRVALVGADRLLRDLGFDLEKRGAVLKRLREACAQEVQIDAALHRQLAERYRTLEGDVRVLLEGSDDEQGLPGYVDAIYNQRTRRFRPIVGRLKHLVAAGTLSEVDTLADRYVHLHLNRLFRADHRLHELVLYDYMARGYEQCVARLSSEGHERS
jgi:lantibiotic biosynthesis protein